MKRLLPDIAGSQSLTQASIDWVGMEAIETLVQWKSSQGAFQLPALAEFKVSLNRPEARGIHMSRLYRILSEKLAQENLSLQHLISIAREGLNSHADLSKHVKLGLRFQLPLLRSALKSDNKGWRHYPIFVKVSGSLERMIVDLQFTLTYSSTCPASLALTKDAIAEDFKKDFSEKENLALNLSSVDNWLRTHIKASAHAQRSKAHIRIRLDSQSHGLDSLESWILGAEKALGTPVQTAVKREDEQAFARLNGENPLFCEDAARRLDSFFKFHSRNIKYHIKVKHLESLHPHNAVAEIRRF